MSVSDIKVLWQAIPNSSQELAVDTRVNETLYHGTRGGGKTDTQLMAFAKYTGLGYGRYWKGVIFDKTYKNLEDIIIKSQRIFGKMSNATYNIKDSKWTWSTGEELVFRRLERDSDYWAYHGHEYCLPDDELIVTSDGYKPIKDIKIGDKVLTLNGFKKVTKKFNVGYKDCYKISNYTLDGLLYSVQYQSETHSLLDLSGEWGNVKKAGLQLGLFAKNIQSSGRLINNKVDYSRGLRITNLVKILSYDVVRDIKNQVTNQLTLVKLCLLINFLSVLDDLNREIDLQITSDILDLCCNYSRFDIDSSAVLQSKDYKTLIKLFGQHLVSVYDVISQSDDTCVDIFNDEYVLPVFKQASQYNERSVIKSLVDKLINRYYLNFELNHPYKKQTKIYSNLSLFVGFMQIEHTNSLHCYDITVEDGNHYITKSGLINKNCFIGFNELTKYATPYLYDTIQSCNRSGFVPEDHPVKCDDGSIYYLPPIPLMMFSTTNPFGAGHHWVKERFIDVAPSGHIVEKKTTVFNPRTKTNETIVRTQVAIFSSFVENIYLSPTYIATLLNYPDPNIRKAWATGSWDIQSGGALSDVFRSNIHVIPRFAIPESWYIDRSFDWGSSHPFSVGWWAQANGEEVKILADNGEWITFCPPAGSLIQFFEYYGAEKIGDNKGLKMSATDIAKNIIDIEQNLLKSNWIKKTPNAGVADNQIWGTINSEDENIGDKMGKFGVHWKRSNKSAGSRKIGLQLIRDMLNSAIHGEQQPHLYFMHNCKASISLLPLLPYDDKKLDDIDTTAEDHSYDMVRYRVLDGYNKPDVITNFSMG